MNILFQYDLPQFVLTIPYNTAVRILEFGVVVSKTYDRSRDGTLTEDEHRERMAAYKAIWDTGASGSAISYHVASDLGLKSHGKRPVHTANGEREADIYLVDFFFQNDIEGRSMVIYPEVTVTDGDIQGVDVLIGMDIIGSGDFAVTNYDGKTCVSFRAPSMQKIDFTDSSIDA